LSLLFVDGVRTSNVVSVTFRSACGDGQITVVCDYTTSFYFILFLLMFVQSILFRVIFRVIFYRLKDKNRWI